MKRNFWRTSAVCANLFVVFLLSGCPKSAPRTEIDTDDAAATASSDAGGSATADMPEVLLEPFDAPSLDELNKQVKWIDQPVIDPMQRYLDFKKENPPEISVEEALKLPNNSPENNRKILSALGQPPASDAEVDYEARANRQTPIDAKSTNPIMQSSIIEFEIAALTGVSLITIDWTLQSFANADFVASYQTTEDRMHDKLVLRDDLTWSDGKPITAHDVEFTFKTIMDPRINVPAVRSSAMELKWVQAYDDRTVVFFHKRPTATHLNNIEIPVLPKHIYEPSLKQDPTMIDGPHIQLEQRPITGGPYKFVNWSRNREIVLERRPEWYEKGGKQIRRKPYFKDVRFRVIEDTNTALLALKNGEIDETELRAEQWATQTNDSSFSQRNVKAMGTEWSFGYIGWNMGRDFFKDKRVRQAMAYAFDHKEMLKSIFFNLNEPGTGIYHPTAWMAPKPAPTPYTQNLDKAEDLLDEAGWVDSDGDGVRDKLINGRRVKFQFSLKIPSGAESSARIASLLKSNLDQIGVICDVKTTEFTVMQEDARTHNFDAMMAGWGTGSDPSDGKNLWTTKALRQNERNYSQYTNPRVDELYEKGEITFDTNERAKIYGEIGSILWEDQPYMWLTYRAGFYGFSKDWRGYMFSPRNPFGYSPGFFAIWKPKK